MDQILALLTLICQKLGIDMATLPVATTTPPEHIRWWRPTSAAAASFATRIKIALANVLGWDGITQPQTVQSFKAPSLGAQPNPDDAKVYAAFGFRPDGTHYLWTQEWIEKQRAFCDKLDAAEDAPALTALCPGAADPGVETDAVIYAFMAGLCNAPEMFSTPHFRVPKLVDDGTGKFTPGDGYATSVADVALYLAQIASASGPGPSGRP